MADIVELHFEKMVPELEHMEKLNFFSKAEIITIKEKRKHFEYRLQRVTKVKEDLLRYIQYEMDLLNLIRKRGQRKGMRQKKLSFEYSIVNHLNKLFTLAIRKFSADLRIWFSYIRFCSQVRFYTSVTQLLEQMLQLHGADKPFLYKFAAHWEWKEARSIERSRKFIHQGLRVHKESKMLYSEAFKLELAFADVKRKEAIEKGLLGDKKEPTDPILKGHLAEVIYDSAITKIRDVTLLVDFLSLTENYKFTSALQEKILEGMKTHFPQEEVTWDTLAKRELQLGGTIKDRIEKCISIYQNGLRNIRTPKMWSLYLDYVIQLDEDVPTLPNFMKNCLKIAFDSAHEAKMLTEKHYLIWIKKVDVDAEKILQWATERFPDSIKLWSWRLRYYLTKGDETGGLKVFREAINKPNVPDQVSLWLLMLKYYQIADSKKGEKLWLEGSNNLTVGAELKPKYIEWLAVTRGIGAARKQYYTFVETPPFSLDLHVSLFKLEDAQPKLSLRYSRSVYDLAVKQYGSINTDVWMWYIKFEEKLGDASKVPELYEKAVKTLTPNLVDTFISEFNLNKASTEERFIPSTEKTEEPMDESSLPSPIVLC